MTHEFGSKSVANQVQVNFQKWHSHREEIAGTLSLPNSPSKALFTRHKLTRVQPGLKLIRVDCLHGTFLN